MLETKPVKPGKKYLIRTHGELTARQTGSAGEVYTVATIDADDDTAHEFISIANKVEIESSAPYVLIITSFSVAPQSSAAAGGASGKFTAGQQDVLSELSLPLAPGCIHELGLLTGAQDLSALAIAAEGDTWSTCELALQTGDTPPSITWPPHAVWLEYGYAPTLNANTHYRFALRQEGSGELIINLAYSYASSS